VTTVGSPVMHDHRGPRSAVAPRWPQVQALRLAVERVCNAGLVPEPLCNDAHALCDDVEAGLFSADHAAEEVRALLGGVALRAQGIGERCCLVADALLADLAQAAGVVWAGRTVPGGEDRANARTGLVELRFPAGEFWAIPAVAHEMGHVLARAPQLGRRPGSGNAARRIIDDGLPAAQREEFFCDFYATYVLGSAFPAFMILERLDPSLAAPERPFPDKETAAATHPTPDKRALVMMRTMTLLDEAAGRWDAPQAGARRFLEAAWRERLTRAGKAARPNPDAEVVVPHLVNRLWNDLDSVLQSGFSTPMAARTLVDDLRAGGKVSSAPGVRVLDLVVAAWAARTTNPVPDQAALSGLADRALAAAERVAKMEPKSRG
jgi:hypothetical protein